MLVYWKDKAAMAGVSADGPGPHSCEQRRQDQLAQILFSFLSFMGLRAELRQVPPGRQDICFASRNSSCSTHCFWEGLLRLGFPGSRL